VSARPWGPSLCYQQAHLAQVPGGSVSPGLVCREYISEDTVKNSNSKHQESIALDHVKQKFTRQEQYLTKVCYFGVLGAELNPLGPPSTCTCRVGFWDF
jgi:hypothetical protein